MNWYTANTSKVVYAPIWADGAEDSDQPARFARMGVRVDLADGTYWFYHFKAGTWTHHWYGVKQERWFHQPEQVEYSKAYTFKALRREYRGRECLIVALLEAHDQAIEADEAKRAA